MMAHSAVQSPTLGTNSGAGNSTRRLRTRAPRSNLLAQISFDDMEYFTHPKNRPRTERRPNRSPSKAMSPDEDYEDHSMSIDPFIHHPASKSTRRLKISRQHRISPPPPLPSPQLPYIRSEKYPAWLLGDAMAKSSANYLSQKTQEAPLTTPLSSQQQNTQTSPIRRSASSFLGTSPLKHHHFHTSLSRQSSSNNLNFNNKRPSLGRSISPDEALDRRREKFWELYEYDSTSPHLQARYFDKPLPTNEQWADLDIQNVAIIPDPQPGPPAVHLVEVFQPTRVDATNPQPPSNSLSHIQLNSQQLKPHIPFGLSLLPSDYALHKK
ncbi:hypothetical protein PGTUg99_029759 [Puccinia graminis f. sp. tritici]|uniref:Uncharacterized protein n=1 Tax=Puccinia graminis f. sp. tritici TaxID=56615 RepID=A0A5B0SED9_PUCGR|nr:hypothetical protein PGTUg99_029759 [Puccinia graminis f. sp. tritici]